jgi:hypothetical protein
MKYKNRRELSEASDDVARLAGYGISFNKINKEEIPSTRLSPRIRTSVRIFHHVAK